MAVSQSGRKVVTHNSKSDLPLDMMQWTGKRLLVLSSLLVDHNPVLACQETERKNRFAGSIDRIHLGAMMALVSEMSNGGVYVFTTR